MRSYKKRSVAPALNNSRGPSSGDARRLADFLAHAEEPAKGKARGRTNAQRFWEKVAKTPGCWFWTGSHNRFGYGHFAWRGWVLKAHRVAYALTHGVPPQGLLVCHTCDCRPCVNPAHLWIATNEENLRDMVKKGRHPETVLRLTRTA
ncbi:MAG TPA: HNH endonuclease signature motif containing protein [Gemmatimonadales bacterium]|nr:HNH endonuclease signature motif containing protein [Gemmatimonadales bacterium]